LPISKLASFVIFQCASNRRSAIASSRLPKLASFGATGLGQPRIGRCLQPTCSIWQGRLLSGLSLKLPNMKLASFVIPVSDTLLSLRGANRRGNLGAANWLRLTRLGPRTPLCLGQVCYFTTEALRTRSTGSVCWVCTHLGALGVSVVALRLRQRPGSIIHFYQSQHNSICSLLYE